MSIGEKESASQAADVKTEKRRSVRPNFTRNTQLAIKNGELTNRKASNQKKHKDSSRGANARILRVFATPKDRVETAMLRFKL